MTALKLNKVSNIKKGETKDVVSKEAISPFLPAGRPEYGGMLANISEKMPEITKTSTNFYKSHTQFMATTVDVTTLTPHRTVKQLCAEIEQTRGALTESYFRAKKAKNKLAKYQRRLEEETDYLEKELLTIKIDQLTSGMEASKEYVAGAVRKLNFYVNQYDNLVKKFGIDNFTEEDLEREETKYHILTAIKQALIAARARGGTIDEGNHIYLFELGINGAHAQLEFDAYFNSEVELLREGKAPTHEHTMQWMEALAEKWKDCPRKFSERRGLTLIDNQSLANLVEGKE